MSARLRPSASLPLALPLVLLLGVSLGSAELHIKQVAFLNRGLRETGGRVVRFCPAPDSAPLLVFRGSLPYRPSSVFFYRYLPGNRYRLVKVDTGGGSGASPGNMIPWETGDADGTGIQKLVARNLFNGWHLVLTLYARPAQGLCPDSLAWSAVYDSAGGYSIEPAYLCDLDQDGRQDILFYDDQGGRTFIYECAGPDSFRRAWSSAPFNAWSFGIGDFDQDGQTEFATVSVFSGLVKVFKCVGNDQYALWDSAAIPQTNGHDVFSGSNLDGANRPMLFASFINYGNYHTYLYQIEPTQGTKGYMSFLIDSSVCLGERSASSCCADIDGDGTDELLWSCGSHIQAYRCTSPHQFEQVWYWSQHPESTESSLTAYDVNGNGYNELLTSGNGRTYIFEIEAIRVLYPNTRLTFHPGDSCRIRWQTYNPPRCDSISLFLRTDTTWQLDTIAHGLPPTETAYAWIMPDIRSDSCRVVAIAYGPGWQYDESDTCFRIAPVGVAEAAAPVIRETRLLGISPNPIHNQAEIRFQLAVPGRVVLRISDVAGRAVASLADEALNSGNYVRSWPAQSIPDGIYFLDFSTGKIRSTSKLIVSR